MPSAPSSVEYFPDEAAVALCVHGVSLEPHLVTSLLGVLPTHSHKAGDRQGLKQSPALKGAWIREVRKFEPIDPDAMVEELLSGMNTSQAAWRELASQFEVRFDFAVHTDVGATFLLHSATLRRLVNLGVDFQIYIQAYGDGA